MRVSLTPSAFSFLCVFWCWLRNFNFNISHDGSWVVLASDCLYLVGLALSPTGCLHFDRGLTMWHHRPKRTAVIWAPVEVWMSLLLSENVGIVKMRLGLRTQMSGTAVGTICGIVLAKMLNPQQKTKLSDV